MNGKKKLIITMAVALILLVGVTVSYGYIALVSTSKNQEVSVSTGKIHLELDDADSGSIEANLNLGGSITKILKITNKGTKPGKVQINWKNLINTYNSRSLSYTLESSSNKTSGYTSVEALRENVPVSTEAKEVPLSKEITVPVGSNPIYYRVTITFNDLEDVDQESDLSATLITQFSLSEPENLSKKVIAVLNGNVKSGTPDLNSPAPKYSYGILKIPINYTNTDITDSVSSGKEYVIYADNYNIDNSGNVIFDFKVGKYSEIYSSLNGKYMPLDYMNTYATLSEAENQIKRIKNVPFTTFEYIVNITLDHIDYQYCDVHEKYTEKYQNFEDSTVSTQSMTSYRNNYITYADSYTFDDVGGYYILENPKTCKFSDSSCYTNLGGKYVIAISGSSSNEITENSIMSPAVRRIETSRLGSLTYTTKQRGSIYIDEKYKGVYKTEDDYGDSYYYRGSIQNNYAKFGGFIWRIMRVNGDGSLRLLYSDTTSQYIDNGNVHRMNDNTSYDEKYAGYMFGGATEDAPTSSHEEAYENKYSSAVKKIVDGWYENNLSSYSNYLSDTLFCNDREVIEVSGNNIYYASHNRLVKDADGNIHPSLKCKQKNDRFTVDDETVGNGALTYPIGLASADEIAYAGVVPNVSGIEENYLSRNVGIITLTPHTTATINYSYNSTSYILIENAVYLGVNYFMEAGKLSPVINIKPEYALKMVGNGTESDPFRILGVN